jgi:hypothetical protein
LPRCPAATSSHTTNASGSKLGTTSACSASASLKDGDGTRQSPSKKSVEFFGLTTSQGAMLFGPTAKPKKLAALNTMLGEPEQVTAHAEQMAADRNYVRRLLRFIAT